MLESAHGPVDAPPVKINELMRIGESLPNKKASIDSLNKSVKPSAMNSNRLVSLEQGKT
jgi:hypothetical protein